MHEMICSKCGALGKPRDQAKGSNVEELHWWHPIPVLGLLYSLWRSTTHSDVCRVCGSAELVSLYTPLGKKLLADHGLERPRDPAAEMGRALGRGIRRMMGRR